jgi:2,4-dienoyl-CoA reductase-like NADH-dependent reductase (Old Yellow Enzyme family)
MTFAKPRAATQDDIDRIIDGFAYAAVYLEAAGFDGIQLHGAHGYLLAQFYSPTTNLRTDKYGGPLQNRGRLIIEIAREIRKRTKPSFSISIKLNSVEFQDRGFSTEDAKELSEMLEAEGFDFVEVSLVRALQLTTRSLLDVCHCKDSSPPKPNKFSASIPQTFSSLCTDTAAVAFRGDL